MIEKEYSIISLQNEACELMGMEEQYKHSVVYSSLSLINRIIDTVHRERALGSADLDTFKECEASEGFIRTYEYTIEDTIDDILAQFCLDLLIIEKVYNLDTFISDPIYVSSECSFERHMLYVIKYIAALSPRQALIYIYMMCKNEHTDLIELMKLRLEYDKYIRTK